MIPSPVFLLLPVGTFVLAQATDNSFWVNAITTIGFPTVVVLLILGGKLVPGFVYDRAISDNERMTKLLEDQALPALYKSNDVLEKATDVLETMSRKSGR